MIMTPESSSKSDPRTDEALIAAANAGHRDAQEELVRRHYAHVAGLAYRLLGRSDAAEDAAQDVFLKLATGRARFAGRSRFNTWLTRIVMNLCIDYRRRKKDARTLPEDLPQPHEDALSPADQDYVAQRVKAAIETLPERQRTALILFRYQNQSYKQIAAATGWSESAVESLIIRAYATLREQLKDLNGI